MIYIYKKIIKIRPKICDKEESKKRYINILNIKRLTIFFEAATLSTKKVT